MKLYSSFNNDPIARKEIDNAWEEAKKEAKGKNPFAPGRIKEALDAYKADMNKQDNWKIKKSTLITFFCRGV